MPRHENVKKPKPYALCAALGPDIADYSDIYGTDEGKFIRIGGEPGALVVVSPYSCRNKDLSINHEKLLSAAFYKKKLRPRALEQVEAADEEGLERLTHQEYGHAMPLHDAGHFIITAYLRDETSRFRVQLFGKSFDYGEADAAGRSVTSRVFENILGSNFTVGARL